MDFQQQPKQFGSEKPHGQRSAHARSYLLTCMEAPLNLPWGCPRRPTVSRKYLQLKMHLIHPTCQASQLSHAALKRAQSTHTGLGLGNHLEFQPEGNCLPRLLTRSGRHRWALCRHNGMGKHDIPKPLATWCTVDACPLPSQRRRGRPPITRRGKDQNLKFQVWFLLNAYRFHAIVKSEK